MVPRHNIHLLWHYEPTGVGAHRDRLCVLLAYPPRCYDSPTSQTHLRGTSRQTGKESRRMSSPEAETPSPARRRSLSIVLGFLILAFLYGCQDEGQKEARSSETTAHARASGEAGQSQGM